MILITDDGTNTLQQAFEIIPAYIEFHLPIKVSIFDLSRYSLVSV